MTIPTTKAYTIKELRFKFHRNQKLKTKILKLLKSTKDINNDIEKC